MRIGILGGSFDPVHIGHLLVAQDAREKLKLDRILFLLAARPPHKECVLSYEARQALLRAALKHHPDFGLCLLEGNRPGPSFTVETLAALKQRHPDDDLFLCIGADQYREIKTWREPRLLVRYARLVVMSRPGTVIRRRPVPARFLPVRAVAISSSEIRRRLRQGLSIRNMVPESVLSSIERNRFYCPPSNNTTKQRRTNL